MMDDEEERAEYKVKRISNSEWCACGAKAVWQMFFKIGVRPATLIKETPTQVFSCEIYEIFKNTFFTEHCTLVAASGSKQCKPMKTYTTKLILPRKK